MVVLRAEWLQNSHLRYTPTLKEFNHSLTGQRYLFLQKYSNTFMFYSPKTTKTISLIGQDVWPQSHLEAEGQCSKCLSATLPHFFSRRDEDELVAIVKHERALRWIFAIFIGIHKKVVSLKIKLLPKCKGHIQDLVMREPNPLGGCLQL